MCNAGKSKSSGGCGSAATAGLPDNASPVFSDKIARAVRSLSERKRPRHTLASDLEPAHERGARSRPNVDAAYADLRDVVRESPHVLISDLIESRYGRRVDEIRQDVKAGLVSAKLAHELEVEAGTPALRIVRHYIDPVGEAVEISVTVHPADRFTFSLRLRRDRDKTSNAL